MMKPLLRAKIFKSEKFCYCTIPQISASSTQGRPQRTLGTLCWASFPFLEHTCTWALQNLTEKGDFSMISKLLLNFHFAFHLNSQSSKLHRTYGLFSSL